MAEVNACIAASADQEVLVDQPRIRRGAVRVSGPFTVEGVNPYEDSLGEESPIGGAPDALPDAAPDEFAVSGNVSGGGADYDAINDAPTNAAAFRDALAAKLRRDGVTFPGNAPKRFTRLDALSDGGALHARGEWVNGGGAAAQSVAVSFGPQYGPVTAKQVEDGLRAASIRGFDAIVFAGFGFDGAAQTAIHDDPNPNVRAHMAHIAPDVNMGGLLKDTKDAQLFTVSGAPRVDLARTPDGEFVVTMEGVDIFDPVDNAVRSAPADRVAAWFLDADYDGRTFCVSQAFFPNSNAWAPLARALRSAVDADAFAAFSGAASLPFPAGEHSRAAVKVIDPRGNEVMKTLDLQGDAPYA